MTPGSTQARTTRDGPFCWQSKAALRRIREAFDSEHAVQSALAVYLALSEVASNFEAETFTVTHGSLAQLCGGSPRTVCQRLRGLEQIGLVAISTPRLKAPSTFTLLRADSQPSRDVSQSLQNDSQPLPNVPQRQKNPPLRAIEESSEESQKKRKQPSRGSLPSDREILRAAL